MSEIQFANTKTTISLGNTFTVEYVGTTSSMLIAGNYYMARTYASDPYSVIRVKNIKGVYSKYAAVKFNLIVAGHPVSDPAQENVVEPVPVVVGVIAKTEPVNSLGAWLRSQELGDLIPLITEFREKNADSKEFLDRIPVLSVSSLYNGADVLRKTLIALLLGHNVLLEGEKATGKNVLASTVAMILKLPVWDVAFNAQIGSEELIGSETFKNGEVTFKPGSLYQAGHNGGLCVLDEINMARPDAVSVLHSALDDRRYVDVPSYGLMKFHANTRVMATMNYGYMGTRELNEALLSRFTVIHVNPMNETELQELLTHKTSTILKGKIQIASRIFNDLRNKALAAEITSQAIDLRGIISALQLVQSGIRPIDAFEMGLVNKVFESTERRIVFDVIKLHISKDVLATEWCK